MPSEKYKSLRIGTGAVLMWSAILFGVGGYLNLKGRESTWVIALFGLPLVVQFFGLLNFTLKQPRGDEKALKAMTAFGSFYCLTMFLCGGANYLFWIWYLEGGQGRWLSYVVVGCIFLFLSCVVVVTFALMTTITTEEMSPLLVLRRLVEWLGNLKDGIAMMPFWSLLHFLTIFLTVAYLFAFAFAFDTRTFDFSMARAVGEDERRAPLNPQYPPLYKPKLPYYESPGLVAANHSLYDGSATYNFYFDDGTANFPLFSGSNHIDPNNPQIPLSPEQQRKVGLMDDNSKSMTSATARIIELAKNDHLVHVLVIGHASDKRNGDNSPYKSNYELSSARAQMVQSEIMKEIYLKRENKWCNVQWTILPTSSDQLPDKNLDDLSRISSLKDPKVAQVVIGPISDDPSYYSLRRSADGSPEALDLMDYLYFSVYTITTTGYGDIAPTSRYAKFLTCLANICEMFFIIGFFNALIALKEGEGASARRPGAQPAVPELSGPGSGSPERGQPEVPSGSSAPGT